jgi:hypothetical protein
MKASPINIFLNTVNLTNTYKTPIFRNGPHRLFATAFVNGTVNGTLKCMINHLPTSDYSAAVTAAGSEDANTDGWHNHIANAHEMGSVSLVAGNVLMDASSTSASITPRAVGLTLPSGPVRRRFEWVNTSGTGTLRIDVGKVGRDSENG